MALPPMERRSRAASMFSRVLTLATGEADLFDRGADLSFLVPVASHVKNNCEWMCVRGREGGRAQKYKYM